MIVGRLIPAGTGSFYHLARRRRPEDELAAGFADTCRPRWAVDFDTELPPDEAEVPAGLTRSGEGVAAVRQVDSGGSPP